MHKALENIFFIFGDGRSGNTFLSHMLMKHTEAVIPPETNSFTQILNKYPTGILDTPKHQKQFIKLLFSDEKFVDWGLTEEELAAEFFGKNLTKEQGLLAVLSLYCQKHAPEATALGLQKDYIDLYPRLRHFLPQARILWLIRDGRAVFNSKRGNLISNKTRHFETSPARAACIWAYKNRTLDKHSRAYGNVLQIKYENMITDTDTSISKVAAFLSLPYHEKPVREMDMPERYNDIHQNVGKSSLPDRIDSWKSVLTPADVQTFERIAATQMGKHGYQTLNVITPLQKIIGKKKVCFFAFKKRLAQLKA